MAKAQYRGKQRPRASGTRPSRGRDSASNGTLSRKRQAELHAERARRKTDQRRKDAAGGVSGSVAERAGDWTLDGLDHSFMERQKAPARHGP